MVPEAELRSLIELVATATEAFTAALFLPQAQEEGLRLVACSSLSAQVARGCSIPRGRSVVGWVAEHRRPMLVSPLLDDSRTLLYYQKDEAVRSMLAVPVALPGNEVGVLTVDSRREQDFPARMQKTLTGFAELFSRLIDQREVSSRAAASLKALEALRDFGRKLTSTLNLERMQNFVVNVPQSVVPRCATCLALPGEQGDRLRIVRGPGLPLHRMRSRDVQPGASLVGWVHRHGRLLHFPHVARRRKKRYLVHPDEPNLSIQAFLGLPLRLAGRTIGVLAFVRQRHVDFPPYSRDVAPVLGDLVAFALGQAQPGLAGEPADGSVITTYGRFHACLEEELAAASESTRLSVFLVDPANLARLNARQGLVAVDHVLEEARQVVARHLARGDRILSIENGSWLVLKRQTGLEEGRRFSEQLERTFAQRLIRVDDLDLEVALPVRVTRVSYPEDGLDREELLEQLHARHGSGRASPENRSS